MKWLTPIVTMLLLVGCASTLKPVSEQSELTVSSERKGIIFSQQYQRGVQVPQIPSQPKPKLQSQPELQLQPTKGKQVQIQQRKIIGYRAKINPATGKITTYPFYEDEKK